MILHCEVVLIMCLVSIVCSLPGIFLVLQGKALSSDAISHSILLGIVVAFLWTKNLNSLWIYVGAVCAAMLNMLISQWLMHKHHIKSDAALGLIFPFFFSVAIALINIYAGSIHLDTDGVLLGDVALTPFIRYHIGNYDLGPQAIWHMLGSLVFTSIILWFCYPKLVIATFDEEFAKSLRIKTLLLHNILLLCSSVSIVSAFDTAGAVMVVACVILPACTAYLISAHLQAMIIHTLGLAIISSLTSYAMAMILQASIPGCLVTTQLFIFSGTLIWYTKNKTKKIPITQ